MKINESLSFDDVLLVPKFSKISSRKEVDTSVNFLGLHLKFPLISANMDTIASQEMSVTLAKFGALGSTHRFLSIEDNVKDFEETQDKIFNSDINPKLVPIVSIGLGDKELKRALELEKAGARRFVIDVAHGASETVVEMYDRLRTRLSDQSYVVVGNFATFESINTFNKALKSYRKPDAFKVGVGGGSMCTTRIVTGCGLPTLSSVIDCVKSGYPIIADGGIKTSGDIVKCLAAGATCVMVGSLLAGTEETPGDEIIITRYDLPDTHGAHPIDVYKKYRGSASLESYEVQDKIASHRAPEGEATLVPYKGPVINILEELQAGVKSGMSYLNAKTIKELQENAEFVIITGNGLAESKAHGKRS